MKPEYKEGPKAKEAFERTMIALFRAPKPKERKQPKTPRTANVRKSKRGDKD